MAQPLAPDYGQQFLFPPALEDWVPADHPARFLREFVDQLDLPKLGFAIPAAREGRPPYAPSLLLKIWLYGYFHRLRSTRKLEAACREHLALLWLTGLMAPDHNSLWRFWNENKKALRQVFQQSAQLALRTGAVGLVLQALDGTKIEAAASGYSGWSKEYMEKLLAALDRALDQTDLALAQENNQPAGYRLPAGLAERQALREQVKAGLAQLAADGRNHHHPVEPEARRMKVGGVNRFAYNAQAVVDSHAQVIVGAAQEANDKKQLVPMLKEVKVQRGVPPRQATADNGYFSEPNITDAQLQEIDLFVAPDRQKHGEKRPTTTGPPPPGASVAEQMRHKLRTAEGQAVYKLRKAVVEPVFGQIKEARGFRRFLLRGLRKVQAEWQMICATHNLLKLFRSGWSPQSA